MFAQNIGFEFFEVSTQQNKGVEEPFRALAKMYRDRYEEKIEQLNQL